MTDTSAPTTRFSATLLAEGWLNVTVLPAPIEKLCQLAAILAVAWLMVMLLPLWLMVALPPTTVPPVGSVCA